MRISSNYNQPSFKMAVKATAAAKDFLQESLNGNQLRKLNKIVEKQKNNPHDILLDIVSKKSAKGTKEVINSIQATGANKKFTSDFGTMATIKKAERYVNKFKKLTFDDVFKKMGSI